MARPLEEVGMARRPEEALLEGVAMVRPPAAVLPVAVATVRRPAAVLPVAAATVRPPAAVATALPLEEAATVLRLVALADLRPAAATVLRPAWADR